MTHIAPRSARGAGLFVRLVYWLVRRRLGRVPAPLGVTAHHRPILAGMAGFELALERSRCISPRVRELATLEAALQVGCRFCIDIGAAMARRHDVSEAELRALAGGGTLERFDPLERDVLEYTRQMTRTPADPDPALLRRLEQRLGVAGVVELLAIVAWENYRARFNHAVGAIEEGFSPGELCLLPTPAPDEIVHARHAG